MNCITTKLLLGEGKHHTGWRILPDAKSRNCESPCMQPSSIMLCPMKEEDLMSVKWSSAPAVRRTPVSEMLIQATVRVWDSSGWLAAHTRRQALAASLTIQKQYPLTATLTKK